MKMFGALMVLFSAASVLAIPEQKDWPYCEEIVELYDIAKPTPLGFSGQDLLQFADAIEQIDINYGYKRGHSKGVLSFVQSSPLVRYVHSKAVYPAQGFDIGIVCADRVEVGIKVTLGSRDGAFADTWETTLRSEKAPYCAGGPCLSAGQYAKFSIFLGEKDFSGSFYDDALEPWVGGVFSGMLRPNQFNGSISHSNVRCDGEGCATSLLVDATIENT